MVRIFGPDPHSSVPSNAVIDLCAFTLEAASESLWGRSMIVSVALPRGSRPLRKQERLEGEAFNLEVRVSGTGTSVPAEVHRELTLGDGPRRVDRVLEEGSRFVRFRKRGEGRSMSKGRFLAVGGSDNLPLDASSMIGLDGGGMNALDRAEGFDLLYIPLTGTIRSRSRRFLQLPRTVAGPTGPYSCWTGLGDGPPPMIRGTAFRRSGRPLVMRPRTQPCTSLA
ncbi:MAG: hypothetical protein A4E31_00057 [Methanomassiliicoccales archaeon PtaU1.Bin030]|nr:MAG: hypothetical protein A4E31_00057 [Methanomassiliicoccales archaeon PtaU1.Bin030]